MQEQDQEVVREFLVESHENLSRLDQELVELEKRPKDAALLASVFRTIHTIKGTCGFLGYTTLEKITHEAESLLSQLRDGERELNPALISVILETVDATRKVLATIEASGEEGPDQFEELAARLRVAQSTGIAGGRSENNGAAEQFLNTKPEETTKTSTLADANIRVGVGLLDKLMDLVGELVLTRNQILQFNTEREDAALNATSQRLNLITTELQEGVMKTRMQPIGIVWSNLPRVVRDMAVSLGKQIRLEMDGTETELDRTIIEAIKDPLVHLVRNACDHGIESQESRVRVGKPPEGRLSLRACHEGGQVNIEISDDGAGIDPERVKQKSIEKGLLRPEQAEKLSDREALNLIFQPGFSTARTVTNISGRGVGMDVVKSNIEKIGGIVDVFSRPGEGSTVKLKIPLTLAIIPGLVITSGGERFVIPQVSLLELIRLEGDSSEKRIEHVHGTPVYRRRGSLFRAGSFERLAVPLSLVARLEEFPRSSIERAGGRQVVQYRNRILPLVTLRILLEPDEPIQEQTSDPVQVIVFNDGDQSVGVVVDQILDVAEETVTVRQKTRRQGLLGSAVVGKQVADFLDLNHVISAASEDWFQGRCESANGKKILVAEASAFSRGLIRSGLDMAGYRVLEAANLDEVIRGLEHQPDVVVTALDLPPDGRYALLAAMRRRPEIPVLALADSAEQARDQSGRPADFQDCQVKFDREAMLESVARLASALASAETGPVCAGEER